MSQTPYDTVTPPPPPPPSGERDDFLGRLGRLRRSTADRKIGGVCGGLGRAWGVDPTVLRVAAVVLAIFGGAGIVLYVAAWLLLPRDDASHARLDLDVTTRGVVLVIAALVAAGLVLGNDWLWWIPIPIALIFLVAVAVVALRRPSQTPAAPPAAAPAASPAASPAAAPTPPPAAATTDQVTDAPSPAPSDAEPGATAGEVTTDAPTTAWYADPPASPPYAAAPVAPPPPPRPRRTGPLLIVPTLALIALGLGVLALLDLNGLGVAPAAYPALAVALTGGMLLVGSVTGRPGGLIALGLAATVALGGTLMGQVAQAVGNAETQTVTPTTATSVQSSYAIDNGDLTLDLTGVEDLEALDGRTVALTMRAGVLRVKVPSGLDLELDARLDLAGEILLLGQQHAGWRPTGRLSTTTDGDADAEAPVLRIDLAGQVGQIEVRRLPARPSTASRSGTASETDAPTEGVTP